MFLLAGDKVRIVKRESSDWWRAVKIKGEWKQIKTIIHIGGKSWSQLFAVELEDGKHLTREDFNRHECIEGNELCGFKIYTPIYTW